MYAISRPVARPSGRALHFVFRVGVLLSAPLASHAAVASREQPAQMSGVVTEIVLDDVAHHTSRVEYQLDDTRSHRHATLRFEGEPPKGLHTGASLEVSGVDRGDGSILVSRASDSTQPTVSTLATMQNAMPQSAALATVVSGVQNTIVIIANFTDATVTSTPGQIQNIMFSDPNGYSIDALYRGTSFGNVGFTGQVVGPFVINFSTASVCDLAAWATWAMDARKASGR